MLQFDLAQPPPVDAQWLGSFMHHFLEEEPRASPVIALEHALLAHKTAWLLDPDEAAGLWVGAVRNRGWLPPR
jgi:hypothetical protein